MAEGVFHEKTGFLCRSIEDMVNNVASISKINRSVCRQIAEEKYSDYTIANEYIGIYEN